MNYEEVVNELNCDLYEKHNEVDYNFNYRTTGFVAIILFDDFVLWSSEDDERSFDEQENEYENMTPFIKKKFNEFADEMQKLKF